MTGGRAEQRASTRPGPIIRAYFETRPNLEAYIGEVHHVYKVQLGYFRPGDPSGLGADVPKTKEKAGRPSHRYRAAKYSSFRNLFLLMARKGAFIPVREELSPSPTFRGGDWERIPPEQRPRVRYYRLTDLGRSLPAEAWLTPRAYFLALPTVTAPALLAPAVPAIPAPVEKLPAVPERRLVPAPGVIRLERFTDASEMINTMKLNFLDDSEEAVGLPEPEKQQRLIRVISNLSEQVKAIVDALNRVMPLVPEERKEDVEIAREDLEAVIERLSPLTRTVRAWTKAPAERKEGYWLEVKAEIAAIIQLLGIIAESLTPRED